MSLLWLSEKRKCSIMTHVVFVAELRHFLQYVFINWRCELSPDGFSQLPVRTAEESMQPIPPTCSPWLSSITSYLVSPFFPLFSMPQSTASGNMPLMSVPLPLSPGPFSPSQTQPLLSLLFCLPSCLQMYISSALSLMVLRWSSQILCHLRC